MGILASARLLRQQRCPASLFATISWLGAPDRHPRCTRPRCPAAENAPMNRSKTFSFVLLLCVSAFAAPAWAQLPTPTEPWKPPLGIPAPSFGINEQAGPSNYYVDNTSPVATDTSNPNGTASRPRASVPTTLPAGAVVEVHGGP